MVHAVVIEAEATESLAEKSAGQPEEVLAVVPGRRWVELPHSFRRLLVRNSLLTALSPAINVASGNHESPPTDGSNDMGMHTPTTVATSPEQPPPFSPSSRGKHRSTVHISGNFTRDFMELGLQGLSAPFAVAATRWCDLFEHLVIACEPSVAAARVSRLRHKTCDGQVCPAPDALGELFPELGELMRDGAGPLLSMSTLPRTYAMLTTAFAGLCSTRMHLPLPMGAAGDESSGGSLPLACREFVREHAESLQKALQEMAEAEDSGDATFVEGACNKVIVMDPTLPEPFFVRAGAHLRAGSRWQCVEDLRMYFWWSTRKGFVLERHVSAYWRLGEAFISELDYRAARQGALLTDGSFHCFVDEAEHSLRWACRFDPKGRLASSAAVQQLLRRIEQHRAARRTAAELLDSPIIGDASLPEDGEDCGVEPSPRDHAVPWPIDLSAGLPDIALFSRFPDVGSSMKHDPMHLLFLDSRGVLDLLTTVQSLAIRSTAFAQRNPECLHWKYRPKPVHIHMQVPVAERLAHALLCIMIIKQVGSSVDSANGQDTSSGFPSFTMEETSHDRFLCALLTAVIFCRTLSPVQRAEVDRLLTLLVMASMDENYMRRAFPWLDLYDNHHSTFSGGAGEPETADQGESGSRNFMSSVPGEWGASLLLFRLQHIWLGWLATSGGEAVASRRGGGAAAAGRARLDTAEVHRAARELLLGPRAATLSASLDLGIALNGRSGLSQRRLWALTGHMPAGEAPAAGNSSSASTARGTNEGEGEKSEDDEDPVQRMRPPDPRLRWQSLREDITSVPLEAWCLNPCVLDPVSWSYDPRALADPFRSFSWCLRGGRRAGAGTCNPGATATFKADTNGPAIESMWSTAPEVLVETADLPLPRAGSNEAPAVEVIWEQMMLQIKAFSAVFNAAEAADAARARDMVPAHEETQASPARTPNVRSRSDSEVFQSELVGATDSQVARPPRRVNVAGRRRPVAKTGGLRQFAPGRVRISDELRERVQFHADLARKQEILPGDVERELADLKRRRHEASLDLELRDYVMLASVKKKEGDWWAKDNQNIVAYREAMDMGQIATWNPAPAACAPIRLRICMYAGSHWQAAKTALRGHAFDAIDSRTLLVSGVGILGLCTWLDSLLKPTAYSYIQTRLCEEVFLEHMREAASSSSVSEDAAANPAAGAVPAAQLPLQGHLTTRGHEHLTAPGARWPPALPSATPRRPMMPKTARLPPSPSATVALPSPLHLRLLDYTRGPPPELEAGTDRVQAATTRSASVNLHAKAALTQRLAPPLFTRPVVKLQAVDAPASRKQRSAQEPPQAPYVADSLLFERLVHESVAAHMTGSQMQYLMGVMARAEPLWTELALDYLGASNSRVPRDLPPWDSSTEVGEPMARNWPGAVGQFSSAALEGTQVRHQRCVIDPVSQSVDPMEVLGRCIPQPGHREKALCLGPRLIRVRRLSGMLVGARRCANLAFCSRQAATTSTTTENAGARLCELCGCAWYCSAACQATHQGAHEFECQALRSIRAAASHFEARGVERNKRTMTVLLENLLSKQFSMVNQAEALVGCTGLSEDLRLTISGAAEAFLPKAANDESAELSDASDDEGGRAPKNGGEKNVMIMSSNCSGRVTRKLQWMASAKEATIVQVLPWTQMVVIPDDTMRWTVQLDNAPVEAMKKTDHGNIAAGAVAHRRLFDVRLNQAHTAAGIVRLMSRWVGAAHRSTVIREVVDDGLIFCVITGLCQTRQFSNRPLTRPAIVSVLSHRMALHIAASQEWRSLAPSLVPPRQFMQLGLQGIECAQYGAYFAFLRPLRLPFAEMRPILPIVCLAWGEKARSALLSLPCPREDQPSRPAKKEERPRRTSLTAEANRASRRKSSISHQFVGSRRGSQAHHRSYTAAVADMDSLLDEAHASAEGCLKSQAAAAASDAAAAAAVRESPKNAATVAASAPVSLGGLLANFTQVASEHLSNIQLVDTVHLDTLTGKAVFLSYTSVVEGRTADMSPDQEAWMFLLDASRGMQTVALPVPVRDLHRCSL